MPYVHLLSSVRITGYVDDTGTISINDHVVWNKPYQDETFFDEHFNKTIPVSYLKTTNNKIYLIAYNSTHNTDSTNGTHAALTFYFTYK